MKEKKQEFMAEEVTEIRYKPQGAFFTEQGRIADYMLDQGQFAHWSIEREMVKFSDSAVTNEQQIAGFVGYKNAGYIAFDPPTYNFFSDKAVSYWKTLEKYPTYKIGAVTRMGLRNRSFFPSDKEFRALERTMFSAIASPSLTASLGGDRTDFAFVVNLDEKGYKFRIQIGVMKPGEAQAHFQKKSKLYDKCGLYVDIDVYKEGQMKSSDVVEFIRSASSLSWAKANILADMAGE